jgi:sugar transferase (PEP-CTERM system associated)
MYAILRGLTWRSTSLVAVDHGLIVVAVLLAMVLRVGPNHHLVALDLVWRASLIAIVLQLCLHYCDLYDTRSLRDRRELVVGVLQAFGAGSVLLALIYYFVPQLMLGRGVFLLSVGLIVTFVTVWRGVFAWLSSRVGPGERLIIVGMGAAALELAQELSDRRHQLGVEFAGFIDAGDRHANAANDLPIIGGVEDIPRILKEEQIDRVVVSLADARGKLPMDQLLQMKLSFGVRFDHLASVYEQYTGKIAVENLRPSWFIFSDGFRKTRLVAAAKRAMDIAFASLGLVVFSPLMLFAAIAVRLGSAGPALYHQRRVGLNGVVFTLHKFRSMRQDAEATTGAVWSKAGDSRVTPVGRFLRRTRLDELPQLWNVLKGDMSIVGPRPERPEFVDELATQIAFYGQRHVVRPGLTGWAQVRHSYGSSVYDALQKLQFDLFYVKHLSVAFDLFIMAETVKTVLVRPGS